VREGYGLTEASFCTLDRPDDPVTPGSVGRPTPGVEVRLSPLGEVEVRGDNLMLGYLDEPRAVEVGGWLATGDIGELRDGRLFIVDRLKDIVLCGGFTVYPAEVERALSHVEGVTGCAVFGLPDPHLGERVAAAVVWPGDDEHRLTRLEAAAAAHLPRYAVPSRWFFVDELPLGPSGKVQKRTLRQRFAPLAETGPTTGGEQG
jgi:acyl-CoA synthetase (AMP-forming)/AMP-acid ligase II